MLSDHLLPPLVYNDAVAIILANALSAEIVENIFCLHFSIFSMDNTQIGSCEFVAQHAVRYSTVGIDSLNGPLREEILWHCCKIVVDEGGDGLTVGNHLPVRAFVARCEAIERIGQTGLSRVCLTVTFATDESSQVFALSANQEVCVGKLIHILEVEIEE